MNPAASHQSTTLPRNFTFHYMDEPRTPEQADVVTEQPQPPKVRIKRRRHVIPPYEINQLHGDADEIPVPTIEVPQPPPDSSTFLPDVNPTPQKGFLAPTPTAKHLTLPTTPIAQLSNPFDNFPTTPSNWTSNSFSTQKSFISRPSSACSNLSDSSASSFSSSDSLPSFGDSCTSPESDSTDPFVFPTPKLSSQAFPMPMQAVQDSRKRKRPHKPVRWTEEMDDHLWMTYLTYLQDPTVTPFKMLPGTAPPLGVCHRVAREAKKTWKGPRSPLISPSTLRPASISETLERSTPLTDSENPFFRAATKSPESPNRARPFSQFQRSMSEDPPRKLLTKWPGSSSATRRRFRELCKLKPNLAPHYQRMMQTRSPSPFDSSSSRSRSHSSRWTSPYNRSGSSSFSTRDLNFSLATSTAVSMQPDGPLAQLATDNQTPRQQVLTPSSIRSNSRSSAHQKSQSLQLHLGIPMTQHTSSMKRLASPFQELTQQPWPTRLNTETTPPQPSSPPAAGPSSSSPKLDPPLEIHAPRPMSGSMKRRAQYQLGEDLAPEDSSTDPRFADFLHTMFPSTASGAGPSAPGKRRLRSRGFSLGAMSHPRTALADLFTPPAPADADAMDLSAVPAVPPLPSDNALLQRLAAPAPFAAAAAARTRRLGSPFAPAPAANAALTNTFPRSLLPPGFLEGLAAPQAQPQQHSQSQPDLFAQPQQAPQQHSQSQPDLFAATGSSVEDFLRRG